MRESTEGSLSLGAGAPPDHRTPPFFDTYDAFACDGGDGSPRRHGGLSWEQFSAAGEKTRRDCDAPELTLTSLWLMWRRLDPERHGAVSPRTLTAAVVGPQPRSPPSPLPCPSPPGHPSR